MALLPTERGVIDLDQDRGAQVGTEDQPYLEGVLAHVELALRLEAARFVQRLCSPDAVPSVEDALRVADLAERTHARADVTARTLRVLLDASDGFSPLSSAQYEAVRGATRTWTRSRGGFRRRVRPPVRSAR